MCTQLHMGKSVPSKDSTMKAAKSGGMNGGLLGAGEAIGRGIIGRGVGTAAGGILAAASESGQTRDTMALVAVERAMDEVLGGGN